MSTDQVSDPSILPSTSLGPAAACLAELALIFAAGILRLRTRAAILSASTSEISPDSAAARLEVDAETVLSVSTRVNGDPGIQPRRDT